MPRRRYRPQRNPLAMLVWLLISLAGFLWYRLNPVTGCDRVVKVYDGDTLKTSSGEKIRLIGLDTPELHESDKLFRDAAKSGMSIKSIKVEGALAAKVTQDLAAGKPIRIEYDMERQDRYGRTLAYVYIPVCEWSKDESPCQVERRPEYEYRELPGVTKDRATYIFLNASLLKAGYAKPMNIRPNTRYAGYFEKLYAQAKSDQRGLWKER